MERHDELEILRRSLIGLIDDIVEDAGSSSTTTLVDRKGLWFALDAATARVMSWRMSERDANGRPMTRPS